MPYLLDEVFVIYLALLQPLLHLLSTALTALTARKIYLLIIF